MYLMKGMAALAMGLVAASCNKMDFDQNAYQQAKEQESKEKFISNVMNGQEIDPNQTWATTKSVSVDVTPRKDGILKIYAANPLSHIVAPLFTTNAEAGKVVTMTVTRPADVDVLYAAVLNENNQIKDVLAFNATETTATVDMTYTNVTRSAARRAPAVPTTPGYASETNPIAQPTVPTNLPTADNASEKITENTTSEWGYSDKTVYLAENVTLTITQQWGGITRCTVYMSPGSKIVHALGTVKIEQSVVYNDGGTIDCGLNLEKATLWNLGTIGKTTANIEYSDNDPGATIYNAGTIYSNDFKVGKNGVLWNEGTVTANGTLKGSNEKTQIYNAKGHRITAAGFEFNNNNQLLWNDGTVTITGAINIYNSNAAVVNYGTLNGASYDGLAGAKFYNAEKAVVNIDGETIVKNSNSPWLNDGTYNSGTFKVSDGGSQVFNNCRLNVAETFYMGVNDGSRFVLQGDASVVCKNFEWNGDNYFWMGSGSMVNVAETLKFNNDDYGYGFYQLGNEYALITAKAVKTDNNNIQWRAWYEGKIYVDTDEHFECRQLSSSQFTVYSTDDVVFTGKKGTAEINWETETTCRPSYKGKKKDPDPVEYYYYAFEDLGAIGDFDFNDVVLRVSAPVDGESTVDLCAAGGKLQSKVLYGNQVLCNEVHAEFEVELTGDDTDMVNTGFTERAFKSLGTVIVGSNPDMANLPLAIEVTGTDGRSTKVTASVKGQGEAPLMIVVTGYPSGSNAGKWFWATERTNITKAYSGFGAWGANASSNQNWYHSYTDGKVWKW